MTQTSHRYKIKRTCKAVVFSLISAFCEFHCEVYEYQSVQVLDLHLFTFFIMIIYSSDHCGCVTHFYYGIVYDTLNTSLHCSFVRNDGFGFRKCTAKSGMPQGSNMRPLFFVLFANDLPYVLIWNIL